MASILSNRFLLFTKFQYSDTQPAYLFIVCGIRRPFAVIYSAVVWHRLLQLNGLAATQAKRHLIYSQLLADSLTGQTIY